MTVCHKSPLLFITTLFGYHSRYIKQALPSGSFLLVIIPDISNKLHPVEASCLLFQIYQTCFSQWKLLACYHSRYIKQASPSGSFLLVIIPDISNKLYPAEVSCLLSFQIYQTSFTQWSFLLVIIPDISNKLHPVEASCLLEAYSTLDVLYHPVPHALHSDDQHNVIQSEVFCLIPFSLNLQLFLPAPSPNKGIMNSSF